ncbi:uncharacterized protein LAJ45_06290 [Morchella importuna]|nr:uncharacterized protein LAJ45_06290 [Morchella importuna]KAH8149659.1 hypothetical protein LAJ45_06290 [Morchella importuna]
MPPRYSIFAAFPAPSAFLRHTGARKITINPSPPRGSFPRFADAMERNGKPFSEGLDARLQLLRPQQPTGQPGAAEEDKRVADNELIMTNYRFAQGDTYAPHDLSFQEQRKRRARKTPAFDAMDLLGINPIKEYRNFSMMSEYVTELGRIKHSSVTGLRPVNQRRMAKAIRRAIGLGLMPAVHRHPEVMGYAKPDRKFIPKDW